MFNLFQKIKNCVSINKSVILFFLDTFYVVYFFFLEA